jgi:hypothetical protein
MDAKPCWPTSRCGYVNRSKLQDASRFLTVHYIVERLTYSSVVPMLSESQTKGLVLRAIQSGILKVEEAADIRRCLRVVSCT